jgi:hypothetical protein
VSNDLLSASYYNDINLLAVYHRKIHQPKGHLRHQPVLMNALMVGLYGSVASASMPNLYPATNAPLIDNFS